MTQAIVTTYFGWTAHKPARIRAKAASGVVWLSYDSGLHMDTNHALAAKKLAQKFKWSGRWHEGVLPNEKGNVYVNVYGAGDYAFAVNA